MIFKTSRNFPPKSSKYQLPNEGRCFGAHVRFFGGDRRLLQPQLEVVTKEIIMTSKEPSSAQDYTASSSVSSAKKSSDARPPSPITGWTLLFNEKLSPQELQDQDKEELWPQYTDADFAEDMNALSPAEREAILEDVHGVSRTIIETDDFVEKEMNAFWRCVNSTLRSVKREAWDRAVYLKPSLASQAHVLPFLRAARFDTYTAVFLMSQHYEIKRRLWGDALLTQRITWNDLTSQEQTMVRRGVNWVVPKNRECTDTPRVAHLRLRTWNIIDSSTATSTAKAIMYPLMNFVLDSDDLQRRGLVQVVDCRGQWKTSRRKMLQYLSQVIPLVESLPWYMEAIHLLFDDQIAKETVRTIQMFFSRKHRLRCRLHFGSVADISKTLLAFGIELPKDESDSDDDDDEAFSYRKIAMEATLLEWQRKEEEGRQSEAHFQDPSSHVALYPNSQDILMGRNKRFALTWPGNVRYNQIIRRYARAYVEEESRTARFHMSMQIIHVLLESNKIRFMVRKDTCWETATESEIKSKVNQALRDEARLLAKRHNEYSR